MWFTSQQASEDKSLLIELWRSWDCIQPWGCWLEPSGGYLPLPSALSAHVCTRDSSAVISFPDSHSLNITTQHKTPVNSPDLNKNQQCYSLGDVISMYDFTGWRHIFLKDFECILKAPWLVQKKKNLWWHPLTRHLRNHLVVCFLPTAIHCFNVR